MGRRAPAILEFSRVVSVDEIGRDGLVLEISADAKERSALAERFGLESLHAFEGTARLSALGDGRVCLKVTFGADVVQSCVVTLEPVTSHISERFEVVYAPATEVEDEAEVFIDVASEEPPEPLIGGRLDVGEMMAQHLAMAIDPYPRSPDAPDGSWHLGEEEAMREGPFDKLKRWKAKG